MKTKEIKEKITTIKNNMGLDVIYVDLETNEVITVEDKNEREALPVFLFQPASLPIPKGYHKLDPKKFIK